MLIVDADDRLQRRPVSVAWRDSDVAVITEGLDEGDVVTLTSLSTAASGSRVVATLDGNGPARGAATGSTGSGP